MTTEFVILAPIVIAILLLVVGLGRYAHGKQLVEQAAAAAARSASLTSTAGAGRIPGAPGGRGIPRRRRDVLHRDDRRRRHRRVPARRGRHRDHHLHRRPLASSRSAASQVRRPSSSTGRAPLEAHRQFAPPGDDT